MRAATTFAIRSSAENGTESVVAASMISESFDMQPMMATRRWCEFSGMFPPGRRSGRAGRAQLADSCPATWTAKNQDQTVREECLC